MFQMADDRTNKTRTRSLKTVGSRDVSTRLVPANGWTEEKRSEFRASLRYHPCFYDNSHEDYMNKKKMAAQEEIWEIQFGYDGESMLKILQESYT